MACIDPVELSLHQVSHDIQTELLALERLCSVSTKLDEMDSKLEEGTVVSLFAANTFMEAVRTAAMADPEEYSIADELFSIESMDDNKAIVKNIGKVSKKVFQAVLKVLSKIGKLLKKYWNNYLGAAATRLKEADELLAEINVRKRDFVMDPRKDALKYKSAYRTLIDPRLESVKSVETLESELEAVMDSTNPSQAQEIVLGTIRRFISTQESEKFTDRRLPTAAKDAYARLTDSYNMTQVLNDKSKRRHIIKVGTLPHTMIMNFEMDNSRPPVVDYKLIEGQRLPKEVRAANPEGAHSLIGVSQQLLAQAVKQTDTYELDKDIEELIGKLKEIKEGQDKTVLEDNILKEIPNYTNLAVNFTKACAEMKLRPAVDIINYVRDSASTWVRK